MTGMETLQKLRARRALAFHGKRYKYPTPNDGTVEIGVFQGLGGDVWIVGYFRDNGARKKINTIKLPALYNPDELQTRLDQWAHIRNLQEVE